MGPVAAAASVHVAASFPSLLILERVSKVPAFDEIQKDPMKLGGGCYELTTVPGLGVKVGKEVFAEYPYRYRPAPFAFHEDGAPAHP